MSKPKAAHNSTSDSSDPNKSGDGVHSKERTMTRKRSAALNKSIDAENTLMQGETVGKSNLDESGVDGDIEEDSLIEKEKPRRGRPQNKGRGGITSANTSSRKNEKKLEQERALQTVLQKDAAKKSDEKQSKKGDKKRTKEKNQSSPLEKKEENIEENVNDNEECEATSGCVMEPVYVQPEVAKFLKNNKLAVATQVQSFEPAVKSSTSDDPPPQPVKLENLSPQELAKLMSVPPPPPPPLPPSIATVQVAKMSGGKRSDRFPSSRMTKEDQATSGNFKRKMPYETQRKKLTYHQKQKQKVNRAVDARLAQIGLSQDHRKQMMYQQPLPSQSFAPVYQAQQFAPPSVPPAQTMPPQPVLLQYPTQYPLQSYSAFPQPSYLFQSVAPQPNTQQPVLPPGYYYNNQ